MDVICHLGKSLKFCLGLGGILGHDFSSRNLPVSEPMETCNCLFKEVAAASSSSSICSTASVLISLSSNLDLVYFNLDSRSSSKMVLPFAFHGSMEDEF